MNVLHPGTRQAGQGGGTAVGLVIGLLIGLGVALGVALYISKVPSPFVDKVPHRTPEQDAAEVERNKNWDPNAPLAGKPASIPAMTPYTSASRPAPGASATDGRRAMAASDAASATTRNGRPDRDPAVILSGAAPDDAGSGAKSVKAPQGPDPYVYFVQAGAFSNADDAEQQRARLAMEGLSAKVTEREQSGRTVYRVRLGPFDAREAAETQQERLKSTGAEAALVRVDRPH